MIRGIPNWLRCRIEPIELLCRLFLGGVFLIAGAGKIIDPQIFESTVRNYQILEDPWIAWAAMTLPPFELIAGGCVILRLLYPGCIIALALAVIGFITALISLLARDIDIECGCLGIATTLQLQLFIDVGLIALAVVLLRVWWQSLAGVSS
ncbi:MAG: MauE/DoxX family redox-associated membrane protein [Verrucomicrobiales bacterium]